MSKLTSHDVASTIHQSLAGGVGGGGGRAGGGGRGSQKSHPFAELDWQRWYRILTKPGALIGELGALVGRVVQVESV